MKTFKDSFGKPWLIEINVLSVKKVRAFCNGFDLAGVIEFGNGTANTAGLDKLAGDPCLLVDVLFILCKEQAEKEHITDEDFARRMNGNAVDRATTALLEELIDFFPETKRRILRFIMEQAKTLSDRAKQETDALLDNPDFRKELEKQLSV